MVVLSSCTNYDDQFDDLNTQINTLKSQIEGFSSLSSGLTSLQGTVASLQTAINNIPVTPATDISGLEASLTSLAADLAALETQLADTTTADAVTTLNDAVEAIKKQLEELLAANNVYSEDLVIDSEATLAFAMSLGDKLSIVNGNVVFVVNEDMATADVQAVASKLVTVTKNVSYLAKSSSVGAINFDNLTSVADLEFVQAGNYNLGKLTSAANIYLGDNYSTKVNVIDLESLTSVTKFFTFTAKEHSSGASATVADRVQADGATTANTIDFSRATNIHLTALTSYAPASLTLKGAKDFTLKIDALTSLDSEGEEVGLTLVVDGALELNNDALVSGSIKTTNVPTVILKKFQDATDATVGNAETLELGALIGNLKLSGTDLEKATITTILDPDNTKDVIGGDITVTSTSISEITISGKTAAIDFTGATDLDTVTVSGTASSLKVSGNSSLTDLTVTAAITGAVTVDNADDLVTLDLAHTVAAGKTATNGSLTITGNAKLTSVVVDKADKLGTIEIENNPELSSVSMAALAAINTGDAKPSVSIKDNALTASKVQDIEELATDAATVNRGKITTTSGIVELKAYLDLAIAGSGTVYVSLDTVDLYVDEDDVETTNVSDWVVVDVAPNSADAAIGARAERLAYQIPTNVTMNIEVDGLSLYVDASGGDEDITPSKNTTLALAAIKTSAALTRATAQGVTFDAVAGGNASTTVTFNATASATTGEAYAGTTHSSATTLAADDYVTLTVNSQSVTATASGIAGSTTGIAAALATKWAAKWGQSAGTSKTASLFEVTASGAVLTVKAKAGSGVRGNAKSVSVSANTGTSTATTPIIDYVIGATRATTDNTTVPTDIILTFENLTAGTIVPTPAITLSGVTSTTLSTTETFNKATATLNKKNTASNIYPLEARGTAQLAEDSVSAGTSNAKTTDYTAWL